ncbi:DUF4331 domain-containing protein [Actinomadura alba]|uniref:DUF4331 domain-containing protein n=1 Tax=Actinomadura alba TaxID=406431 RepID=A0ABR7LWD1_9ACTN|nr:DUF4331 domain-containing protein [Actinomadura alba]MBC6468822.1 DUF4331 domain-containing protein [Actinomadura alba]
MPRRIPTRKRAAVLAAAGAALLAGGSAGLAPVQATASSHREAPIISGQPQYDNTDVYAFVSPDRPDTTTLVADFIPFQEPAGGPNFYKFAQDARYEINVDNDGDSLPEFTYRFTFKDHYRKGGTFLYNTGPVTSLDDPDLNFRQTYDLTLIQRRAGAVVNVRTLVSGATVAPSHVGRASIPDYKTLRDQAIKKLPSGLQVYAGQADDPFFLDLRVFDLLYGGDLSEVGNDTLRGYNVNTIALQVPTQQLIKAGQPIIGVYSAVQRRNAAGVHTQVSRLGMPLVNEVVIPVKDKDRFNASVPWHDAQFGKYVTDPELPRLIQGVYKIPAPAAPRKDLVSVFLTGVPKLNQPPGVRPAELMRLNTSIPPSRSPKRLGVLDGDNAGYPNGRRLTDDVVDISLQVVEGELVGKKNDLGDGVDANDVALSQSFPYVGLPASGSAVRGGRAASGKGAGTQLDAGNRAAESPDGGGLPTVPIIALTAGAAFLTGGFLMWFRRTRSGSL